MLFGVSGWHGSGRVVLRETSSSFGWDAQRKKSGDLYSTLRDDVTFRQEWEA